MAEKDVYNGYGMVKSISTISNTQNAGLGNRTDKMANFGIS